MAIIRVNPDLLIQHAGVINSTADQLRLIGKELTRTANEAPSYDGQFGPLVTIIGLSAMAGAKLHSSRHEGQATRLYRRAAKFKAADAAGYAMYQNGMDITTQLKDAAFLWYLSIILGLPIAVIISLINLGMLADGKPTVSVTGGLRGLIAVIWARILESIARNKKKEEVEEKDTNKDQGKVEETITQSPVTVVGAVSILKKDSAFISQKYKDHKYAIDIAADTGDPISASYKGTVVFSSDPNTPTYDPKQYSKEDMTAKENWGYGNMMIIEYKIDDQPIEIQNQWMEVYGMKPGQSIYALYAHLNNGTLQSANSQVLPGDQIAEMDNSGLSGTTRKNGGHVHLDSTQDSGSIGHVSNYSKSGWSRISNHVNPELLDAFLPNTEPQQFYRLEEQVYG